MKLQKLAAKPELVKLVLDDEDTVKEFGESLEFYIYDRQPIGDFVKIASLTSDDFAQIVEVVNNLILDEEGNKIITNEMVLPQKLYVRVVQKVIAKLGE